MVQEDGAASGSAAALRTEAEGVNDTGDRMKLKCLAMNKGIEFENRR